MHRSPFRLSFVLLAFAVAPLHASIIQVSTTAGENSAYDSHYASCGVGVLACTYAGATVTLSTNPVISLSASSGVPDPGLSLGAGGSIEWSVDILGGASGDQVTLDVRYLMYAYGASNDSGADIDFNGVTLDSVCDSCGASIPDWVSGVKQVIGTAGGANDFTEIVAANSWTGVAGNTSGSTRVYADPYIYIDPTFAAANPGYSLDFGDAGNSLPVGAPEPAAAWLGLIGAAGVVIRRWLLTTEAEGRQ